MGLNKHSLTVPLSRPEPTPRPQHSRRTIRWRLPQARMWRQPEQDLMHRRCHSTSKLKTGGRQLHLTLLLSSYPPLQTATCHSTPRAARSLRAQKACTRSLAAAAAIAAMARRKLIPRSVDAVLGLSCVEACEFLYDSCRCVSVLVSASVRVRGGGGGALDAQCRLCF
jgi:hypothetical protein